MKVVYFQRKPWSGAFSLEGYFDVVRQFLPRDVTPVVSVASFRSVGAWRRLGNLVEAAFHQGDVNHVTGDIHYVTYLLRKRRTLLTVLDCRFEEEQSTAKKFALKLLWYILPEKRVEIVTTISEFTKRRFIQHTRCVPSKVRVIYTCVSPLFREIQRPFNAKCPVILQVGTAPNKNLDRLCAAVRGIPCKLHIIGELSPSQIRALTNIDYMNSVDLSESEIVQAYADADIVAFASTYEGFGMPIVEANVVGRPVLAGNVASMPEIAGDAACLVDPFDVAAIRQGILKLIRDDCYRESLIKNGFRNRMRFDPEGIAQQYTDLYRRLSAHRETHLGEEEGA